MFETGPRDAQAGFEDVISQDGSERLILLYPFPKHWGRRRHILHAQL